jgi:hypothetical protein
MLNLAQGFGLHDVEGVEGEWWCHLRGLRRTARPTMAKEREPLVEVIEEKEMWSLRHRCLGSRRKP